ncbi:MAG: OadG family protein [Kiritimatiellae bacterium]|jgi:oxaloacetate decarboxylase gamma subunit|nr:OadG family protein [Kiritimatiellia bacterium]
MAILAQGLVLLIAGMGIVFAFLTMLVCVMSASSKIIPKFNHILPDEQPKKRAAQSAALSQDDTAIAIAIAATVAQSA